MKRINLWKITSIVISASLITAGCALTEKELTQSITSQKAIVETGQNEAYSADGLSIEVEAGQELFGQDAHYSSLPFSFIDNGDGTVADLNTGLIWLQQPSDIKMDWYDAMEYTQNLEFAGRDDWRAPTLTELFSIENFGDGWPYLDMKVFSFGDRDITKELQFWSSNFYKVGTTHGGAESAFGVNFATGHIKAYPAGGYASGRYATRRNASASSIK
ncbi:DUF1566 domain-containing protein [Psychromonas sp. KJ10-10]|uniref:Lcl C-terminal domain-containing protein n=1 Tax=Psychromonas sp. KJ10-10 TaxID=3391823 RepID=UPI0039B3C6CD